MVNSEELIGTAQYLTLEAKRRINRYRYNRVLPYFIRNTDMQHNESKGVQLFGVKNWTFETLRIRFLIHHRAHPIRTARPYPCTYHTHSMRLYMAPRSAFHTPVTITEKGRYNSFRYRDKNSTVLTSCYIRGFQSYSNPRNYAPLPPAVRMAVKPPLK